MEIISGLVVVMAFMVLLAIAMGWCGERYEVRSKLREENSSIWDDELKNKEQPFLTQQQKEVIAHIESQSHEDRQRFLFGDWKGEP